jgi:copper chaperone
VVQVVCPGCLTANRVPEEKPMKHRFEVANIKCGGCARSIERALGADPRVTAVQVDIDSGAVSIEAAADAIEPARATLLRLGYPEVGSAEGIEALKAKAKSFVSCAVGRFAPE